MHPSPSVQSAIVRLCDELCTWERETGRNSVLIIREEGGFFLRAASGKTTVPEDVTDAELLRLVTRERR